MLNPERTADRGIIASYVDPQSFGRLTRAALRGLGYDVVQAAFLGRFDDPKFKPSLWLVSDRHLDRLPSRADDPDTPIIVVAGRDPRPKDDPRVVGQLLRPIRLSLLYPMIQEALEPTPRGAPRVMTELVARIAHSGNRFVGQLDSLSIHGCHVRDSDRVSPGMRINIEFALPGADPVLTRAACVTRTGEGAGLVFDSTSDSVRDSIDEFVTQRLAAMPALA
jgi:hypothetical protein